MASHHGYDAVLVETSLASVGVMMGSAKGPHTAPITLQPMPVSKPHFEKVLRMMPVWNTLIDRVARTPSFLAPALADTAEADPEFVGRLLQMYLDVFTDGGEANNLLRTAPMLGIFRSDYLPSSDAVAVAEGCNWKHIEINTISCSFGAFSTLVGRVHSYLGTSIPLPPPEVSSSYDGVVGGIASAHTAFEASDARPGAAVVVFVVQEGENNSYDQHLLALKLWEDHRIRSIRRSMGQLDASLRIDSHGDAILGDDTQLASHPNGSPVSVFYFRAGYRIEDFPSEKEWRARRLLEQSTAVKCPSLPYHLCTMKRVQQLLSSQESLAPFFPNDADSAALLSQSFLTQYSLGDRTEATQAAVRAALERPSAYVLKPQLEGGGNLITGAAMKASLERYFHASASEQRSVASYVLMAKVVPPPHKGYVWHGKTRDITFHEDLVGELGTFGVILSRGGDDCPVNAGAGYLMRTKPASIEEGGVMAGSGALDSITYVE